MTSPGHRKIRSSAVGTMGGRLRASAIRRRVLGELRAPWLAALDVARRGATG
jgi:hypothetical protein